MERHDAEARTEHWHPPVSSHDGSAAPDEAGTHLLSRLGPVLRDLDHAVEEVNSFREGSNVLLRINAGEAAARLVLANVVLLSDALSRHGLGPGGRGQAKRHCR